jgi:NAD(P)-dependent dehydrogenase (short-subunit alcohol dehydrogenase family)
MSNTFCLINCGLKAEWQEKIMKGKVVLVTGANGGLGTSVTQAFLDAGAKVVGTSREIRQAEFPSPDFTAVSGDIAGPQGAKLLIDQVIKKFGRLDVLAHTVGGFAGGQSIADTDDKTFQQMFEMNLNATFYLLRAAIPELRKTGNGRIIAIGSRAALEPGAGVGAYSASKAAMVSIIRTANVILPGTMDTPANRKAMSGADFSKWVKAATVASLMVWLAGAAGTDVNGAVIPVYGES